MASSSEQIVTGYTYWGSYAGFICIGKIKNLQAVKNGDTLIWDGFITSDSADANGMTLLTTTMGTIRFYWGSPTQNIDDLLASLEIDRGSGPEIVPMSAFRNLAYFVADDLSFGQQTTPPTLRFTYEVVTSGLALSQHTLQEDTIIPEAIYTMLTNALYGDGILPGDIDTASFIAAAETTIDEGLVASPDIDAAEGSREIIGRMLSYIDGTIYWNGGKLVMKLNRTEDVTAAPVINESLLIEEPRPDMTQLSETWNRTIVTFHDKENKWEETGAEYVDDANFVMQGRKITKIFNMPWITRREVAESFARYLGQKGGVPAGFWNLTVQPSQESLQVGQLIKLTYLKFGIINRVCRIKRKTIKRPSDPSVDLTVFEERQRDISGDFLPPADQFYVPGILDQNASDTFAVASTTPRLSTLPPDLRPEDDDGFLVAMEKPGGIINGGQLWFTWNPAELPYRLLAAFTNFPAKATLLSWYRIRATSWLLRIELASAADYEWLQTLVEDAPEVFAVVGVREFNTDPAKDEHQTQAPWFRVVPGGIFDLVSATVIDIEIDEGAWFGSTGLDLETIAADGRYPTEHIYFGRREDFVIYPTSTIAFGTNTGNSVDDTGLVRYIKTPLENFRREQTLDDVTATTFDRDDATMSPEGTLSREWGAKVRTAYEIADIEFGAVLDAAQGADYAALVEHLDTALGAIYEGTATADQTLLAEDVDDTLGAMVETGSNIYNEAP